jgi:hypothetical protein
MTLKALVLGRVLLFQGTFPVRSMTFKAFCLFSYVDVRLIGGDACKFSSRKHIQESHDKQNKRGKDDTFLHGYNLTEIERYINKSVIAL